VFVNGFAQQFNLKSGCTKQKNAVSIDFGTIIWDLSTDGFGIGANYERSISNMFSVLGRFSYSYHKWNYFSIELHGRWYPIKTSLGKLFTDIGMGHGFFRDNYSSLGNDWYVHTLKISAGWKFIFKKIILFEPLIGYGFPLILTNENLLSNNHIIDGSFSTDLKISGNFNIGLNIGWVY
jgi:hypothetical protein